MQAQHQANALPNGTVLPMGAIPPVSKPSPVAGLRPVALSARVKEGVTYVTKEIGRGLFHGWGKEFEEFDSGACEVSVAIVELDNGEVETYCANQVRFLDREPDGQA
jgi:hypothetical protein